MSGWTRWMFAGAVLLGAVAAGLSAEVDDPQDQLQPVGGLAFRDEIELTVMNLIVNVSDKNGEPVTDLTKDDFEVYQDGEPKPVTNFQVYTEDVFKQYSTSGPSLPPDPDTPPSQESELEPRPVHLVMYVDHYNLNPIDRNRVLSQLERFVRDNVQPPVQMMVVSRIQSPEVVQDFTSESSQVIEQLRGIRKKSAARSMFRASMTPRNIAPISSRPCSRASTTRATSTLRTMCGCRSKTSSVRRSHPSSSP